jgi:hypothetical protein
VSGLTARHFELYRLMLACSAPGQGGRPVCSYGQAKLAARLGVTDRTVQRLISDMREPGTDVRHPGVEAAGARLGWLLVLPQERPGRRNGRLYGGNRYVLQLDPGQVDQLEASHLASGHTPRSQRSVTPEEPVSPGRNGATRSRVSLSRYVRSTPPTGGDLTHPESEPAGSALQQQPATNNGRRRWVPTEEWIALQAKRIAANPLEGVAKAEAYLAECRRRAERLERMRTAGRAAREREARGELGPRPRPKIDPAALTPEQRRQMAALEALPDFPEEQRITGIVTGTSRPADREQSA